MNVAAQAMLTGCWGANTAPADRQNLWMWGSERLTKTVETLIEGDQDIYIYIYIYC